MRTPVMHELRFGAPAPLVFSDPALLAGSLGRRVRDLLRRLTKLAGNGRNGDRLAELGTLQDELRQVLPRVLAAAHAEELSTGVAARRAAEIAQVLALGAHEAWKQAAADYCREAGRFFNRGPAVDALGGALASAWDVLCTCARSYAPVPAGFWRDCHRIFGHLLAQGWMNRVPARETGTLADLYRRLLVLGVGASNRFEPAQVERLIALALEEAAGLGLVQLDEALGEDGAFVFKLELDQPPRFVDHLPEGSGGIWWRAELQTLAETLAQRIAELQRSDFAAPQALQLLGLLQREWADPPRRRHSRRPAGEGGVIELVTLLPGCWRTVQAATGRPPLADWGLHADDDEDLVLANEAGEGADVAAVQPAWLSVSNMSRSGLLLEGEASGQPLRAGELILCRSPAQPWRLGLIRWVAFRGGSLETQCGVEFLGHSPAALMVAAVVSHPQDRFRRALGLRRGRRLVVPGRLFQPMRELVVADGERQRVVRAVRLVQQLAHYQIIDIRVVDAADGGALAAPVR